MTTFEDAAKMLEDIAIDLPKEFYGNLNGGVNLLPDVKHHPLGGGLHIMGEYHNDPKGLGRYINIYFGSFINVYANNTQEQHREELKRILLHEFTHHLESLAGERDLEIRDAIELGKYRA